MLLSIAERCASGGGGAEEAGGTIMRRSGAFKYPAGEGRDGEVWSDKGTGDRDKYAPHFDTGGGLVSLNEALRIFSRKKKEQRRIQGSERVLLHAIAGSSSFP